MSNRSLNRFIFYWKPLEIFHPLELKTTLYEFTVGIARGLDYLHQGFSTNIVTTNFPMVSEPHFRRASL
ncbi:putative receptor-like protein kinase isoform X3 [Gossypium australe]|uniref:Putative receptor-like protein kinase isoform X3 n=1 Tax=Gossypium australe TaxID=47621 RepID=A0A5B6UZN8_9ROSI|nr:putative receptor-like protein kinase isoform X3 [Gossypium australe]